NIILLLPYEVQSDATYIQRRDDKLPSNSGCNIPDVGLSSCAMPLVIHTHESVRDSGTGQLCSIVMHQCGNRLHQPRPSVTASRGAWPGRRLGRTGGRRRLWRACGIGWGLLLFAACNSSM